MNLASKGITYQVNTVENLNFPNLKKKEQNHYLLYGLLTSNLKKQTKWQGNTVQPSQYREVAT